MKGRAVLCLIVVLLSSDAFGDERQHQAALPPQSMEILQGALLPMEPEASFWNDWVWEGLEIRRHVAVFTLQRGSESREIVLSHPARASEPEPGEPSGTVQWQGKSVMLSADTGDAPTEAFARALLAADARGDFGALWETKLRAAVDDGENVRNELRMAAVVLCAVSWVLVFAFLLFEAVRSGLRASPRCLLAALGLVVGPLLVRAAFATWGPGDLQPNLIEALLPFDLGGDWRYGPAPEVLLRALFTFVPPGHDAIVVVNLISGAFAPVLAFGLVRAWGRGREEAVLVFVLVALHPLLVRYAGEGNRQALFVALALTALWSQARFLRSGRVVDLVVAGAATILCVQTRPEGALLAAPLVLAAVFLQGGERAVRWSRRLWAAVPPVVLIVVFWFVFGAETQRAFVDRGVPDLLSALASSELHGRDEFLSLNFDFSSWLLAALAGFSLVVGIVRRDRLVLWAVLTVACVDLAGALYYFKLSGDFLSTRYYSLGMPVLCILAASGLGWLRERLAQGRSVPIRAGLLAVAVVCAAAASVPNAARVLGPFTIDHEYEFLREHAPSPPEGATVFTVPSDGDYNVRRLASSVPALFGLSQQWKGWDGTPPAEGETSFYYQSSACSSRSATPEIRALCRRAREVFVTKTEQVEILPNRPCSFFGYETADGVEVGFYSRASGRDSEERNSGAP